MNNKGFTLVEMLAVIVILAILSGIATYGVINAIKTSKDKAEDAFLNEMGHQIETYIGFNSPKNKIDNSFNFTKTIIDKNDDESSSYTTGREVTVWEVIDNDKTSRLTLKDLLDREYSDDNNYKNPNTDKECKTNNEIVIFMDSDFVYYYYVDFDEEGDCISNGKIVNSLPKELVCSLPDNYSFIRESYNDNTKKEEDKCI